MSLNIYHLITAVMSLNIYQQVFELSLISNMARNETGTQTELQAKILTVIPPALQKYLGSWEVSWGPTVWKHDGDSQSTTTADNTWYIAHNPAAAFPDGNYDTYVVAIAATQGKKGSYDWVFEDSKVEQVVDVDAWITAGLNTQPNPATSVDDNKNTYLSLGTASATYTLMNTASGGVNLGSTIASFLATLPLTARVIFTGHSLGGALSPALAYLMKKANLLENIGSVLVFPTAGPSPGNGNFAAFFKRDFPPTSGTTYQVWNSNLFNIYDLIPQAWATNVTKYPQQNLINIKTLWPENFVNYQDAISNLTQSMVQQSGIQYAPIQSHFFQGNPPIYPPPGPRKLFLDDVDQEHVTEYCTFFKVSPPSVFERPESDDVTAKVGGLYIGQGVLGVEG